MNYEVLIRSEAGTDLLDAVVYYEEKLKGLGNEFINYVESALEIISNQPESFPIVYKNVRRALIRRFPFGIHYIIEVFLIYLLRPLIKNLPRSVVLNKTIF